MEKETQYFRRLDIIRILSCALVLLYHLNIIKGGFLAVCTFFVLSGYLTCTSALKNENFSIKRYYKNRIKKLYFPLVIVVFTTVILAKIIPDINWTNLKPETLSVVFGYNNIWQINANLDYFTRNINSPFIHLWYISILLQFDLIFPLLFTLLKRAENKMKSNISVFIVAFFTIMATVLFYNMSKTQNFTLVYYNSFARSFSILFGVLLALIHYKYNFKLSKVFEKDYTYFFIAYNVAFIALCIFLPDKVELYAISMIIATIISTRLIGYSIKESTKNKKNDKYINILSKMSYEVYLVQYPIIFFMRYTLIADELKTIIILILTLAIAFVLHLLLNVSLKSNVFKTIRTALFATIIMFGAFFVITEKDYTNEMKELESRLNENLKIAEEKNKEYLNNADIENEEKNSIMNIEQNKENSIKNIEQNKIENEPKTTKNEEINVDEKIRNLHVVGVGDSVMLDATKAFYNKFPKGYFDGKISRTVSGAKEVLINLKNKGKLGNIVILCLATNGDYSDRKNRELMNILGNRKMYWVNAVGADDPKFNDRFKNFAKNYSNIHIVEWEKIAKNHPEYLEPDKIHPNYKGGKAMVQLIYDTIRDDYLEEYKQKR